MTPILPTPQQIIDAVAESAHLETQHVMAGSFFSLRQPNREARQVAMLLMKSMLGMTHVRIAAALGLQDHTTISFGLDRAYRRCKEDQTYAALAERARSLALRMAEADYVKLYRIPEKPRHEKIQPVFDVIPYRRLRAVPNSYEALHYPKKDDIKPSRDWWLLNDIRFCAALALAHPELVQPNMRYGRFDAAIDQRISRHASQRA